MNMEVMILNSETADYERVLHAVSEDRRRLSLSFVFERDRRLSACAGLFMKYLETVYDGKISVDPLGKPRMDRICFNISHSGRYVACAVSGYEIGVDIEQIGANSDLAPSVMTPGELELFSSYSGDREVLFTRFWTAKESVMKAVGLGMELPPGSFRVLYRDGIRQEKFGTMKITELEAPPGYCISVCSSDPDVPQEAVSADADAMIRRCMQT